MASRDAQRRAKIDQTITAFRGDTDRETMVALAAVLREGVERTTAGERFVLMPQGPLAEKNSNEERKRDRSAKWL
jgi:hypothetical protein